MTTVTAYTAARMQEIENSAIIDGDVVGDDLILTRFDTTTINAGNVRGPEGPPGGGFLGIAQSTTSQGSITAEVDLVGCSVTVTVDAGRRIKLTAKGSAYGTIANDQFVGRIKEGATILGRWFNAPMPISGRHLNQSGVVVITPSSGVHTYKLSFERTIGTGTANFVPSAEDPIILLVEDIGPV